MAVLYFLFIGLALHLIAHILEREIQAAEGMDGIIYFIGPIVVMGMNVMKYLVFFALIYGLVGLSLEKFL